MMKYCYEHLDIDGVSVADAITALQVWKDEHPDAVQDSLTFGWDGDDPYFEVMYQRPMNEEELAFHNAQLAQQAESAEQYERETYERLKAKYEGN